MDSGALFNDAAGLVVDYWSRMDNEDRTAEPVCKNASPADIEEAFASIGMPIPLEKELKPTKNLKTIEEAFKKCIEYSAHTAHPLYAGQLYGRADRVASAADIVAIGLNTHAHTYESTPVFTPMEHALVHKICHTIGGRFAETPDGCFVPGGSTGNMFGMLLARHTAFPDARQTGLFGLPKLQIYASELSHYSAQKMGQAAGIGTNNVIAIKVDNKGCMDVDCLEQAIQKTIADGGKPLMIMATSGTTVSGTFDPLDKLVTIRDKYKTYLHVDCCWGAPAVFSKKYRHYVKGVEQVDSIVFSLHKGLSVPTQCAIFLTPHKGMLHAVNHSGSSYLFQKAGTALLDIGDKSIQCSRRTDSLKAWICWRNLGDEGLDARATSLMDTAATFVQKVEKHPSGSFRMAYPFGGLSVCFWYIPKWLQKFDAATASDQEKGDVAEMHKRLKKDIQHNGGFMCTVTPLIHYLPHFFRFVFPGANSYKDSDLDLILQQILDSAERLGFTGDTNPLH